MNRHTVNNPNKVLHIQTVYTCTLFFFCKKIEHLLGSIIIFNFTLGLRHPFRNTTVYVNLTIVWKMQRLLHMKCDCYYKRRQREKKFL